MNRTLDEALAEVKATHQERADQQEKSKQREEAAFRDVADAFKAILARLNEDGWSYNVDVEQPRKYEDGRALEPYFIWAGDPQKIAMYIKEGRGEYLRVKVWRNIGMTSAFLPRATVQIELKGLAAFAAWVRMEFPIRKSEEETNAE